MAATSGEQSPSISRGESKKLLQFVDEGFRVAEVGRLKPFREPAIRRGERLAAFVGPALAAENFAQAHRRPQFERAGVLKAGDVRGLPEVRLGRLDHRAIEFAGDVQSGLAAQAVQLRFVKALAGLSRQRQRLVQDASGLFELAAAGQHVAEQAEVVRLISDAVGREPVDQAFAQLFEALILLACTAASLCRSAWSGYPNSHSATAP